MLSKEERERLMNMSPEERKADFMDSVSDSVRESAKKLAMMKAMVKNENGIDPDDFDKAFNREYEKAWDKFKDKNSMEIAIMGLLELATQGADISEILGGGGIA